MEELLAGLKHAFTSSLLGWYEQHKRSLPWRDTTDPYIIWISEVILQQTRVDQGYDYFVRFVNRFPDVKSLAESDEQDVLRLWQGLGYYSRARNLHKAARDIENRFDGFFPSDYKDVLSLSGIGEYTAAAIVSFAYGLPYAVVDGNVFRVLSRLFAIDTPIDTGKGKKVFTHLAQQMLYLQDPAIYNQAVMELGALQCVPVNPDCGLCPVSGICAAYSLNKISDYPVKQGKTLVKNRYFNYLDIRSGGFMFLKKREGSDIWKNLYEFPLIETDKEVSLDELLIGEEFLHLLLIGDIKDVVITPMLSTKHVLSHRIIYASFYKVIIPDNSFEIEGYLKVDMNDIDNYPVSRLVDKYLEKYFNK